MSSLAVIKQIPDSPAFILDETQVLSNLQPLQRLSEASGCKLLYSIKALPLARLLRLLQGHVDGFAVSSLFEARLAREVLDDTSTLHVTSPGLRSDEFTELAGLCTHVSFNSLSQQQRLQAVANGYSAGLRINPKRSFVDDVRYDPCRLHSKLGVDIQVLQKSPLLKDLAGLHFHTVFAQRDFSPLLETLAQVVGLVKHAPKLQWLNLGGGYLFHSIADQQPLIDAIRDVRQRFELDIFVEPGKALVGNAGYLLTTVLDCFVSDGKTVLVLDTSINHHPEVFEYQKSPDLVDAVADGAVSALLVGSTCLAGDGFGEYHFDRLPAVGDRLLFRDVGAYSLIKANRFNGYNLPTLYSLSAAGIQPLKHYDYPDYRQQWL